MQSFYKKTLSLFAILQLLTANVNAETTSHIALCQAYTGSGLAEEISAELDRVQENALAEGKFFEFTSAIFVKNISKDWTALTTQSHFYVLYTLTDKMGETNPDILKVIHISAWTYSGLQERLQEEIDSLQNLALSENREIRFLEIKITQNSGNAYIIYEISR